LRTSQLGGSAEETVEVSHEALIHQWQQLKQWVDADRQFLAWQQRLNTMRKEWEASQRNVDLLLRGLPLREAVEWHKKKPDSFSPHERVFIASSQHRKVKARTVAAIGIGLVLWLIGGTTWLWQKGYDLDQAALKIQSLVVSIHVPPQMVEIPSGTFQQGDVEKLGVSSRNPVRPVTIRAFNLGKYEVTFEEYDRFAIDTGWPLLNDQGWGRGRRPVINVSWDEAKAYADWLSKKTNKRYRLPSESEWEYAARRGAKQEAWAGTSEESQLEKYAVFSKNAGNKTAIVGEKEPNGFGLHDMSGNVFEWVEDCIHGTYEKAPTNESAWLGTEGGDCGQRVIRGGSWYDGPVYLRVSGRGRNDTFDRGDMLGFRLVQDIP
jgi:formylglycine-generating enzyme required for sulfatase activity